MGAFKPLLDLGGQPALVRLLRAIDAAGVRRVLVVIGHRAQYVEVALEEAYIGRYTCVFNPLYKEGMFTSVQTGVRRACDEGADGVLLFPADVPLVAPSTVRAVLDAALADSGRQSLSSGADPRDAASGCRDEGHLFGRPPMGSGGRQDAAPTVGDAGVFVHPVCLGRNGHPLFIPAAAFGDILGFPGEGGLNAPRDACGTTSSLETPRDASAAKGGLKAVRDAYAAQGRLVKVDVVDEGSVLDMDTPEDYERLCAFFS